MLVRLRGLLPLCSLLFACASTPAAQTKTAPGQPVTAHPSDHCKVTPRADSGITIVAAHIPCIGFVGAVLPGLGWQVDCGAQGNHFVQARNDALARVATITVDTGKVGAVDLQAYAAEQIQWAMDGATRDLGITLQAGKPQILGEGLYAFALQGDASGKRVSQLNAHHVVPTPNGLLRYHLSETASDGRVLNEHAPQLIQAATAFGIAPQQ